MNELSNQTLRIRGTSSLPFQNSRGPGELLADETEARGTNGTFNISFLPFQRTRVLSWLSRDAQPRSKCQKPRRRSFEQSSSILLILCQVPWVTRDPTFPRSSIVLPRASARPRARETKVRVRGGKRIGRTRTRNAST